MQCHHKYDIMCYHVCQVSLCKKISIQNFIEKIIQFFQMGAQWLSGRLIVSKSWGCGFEPHRRHEPVYVNSLPGIFSCV